jgi:hypothetical protein
MAGLYKTHASARAKSGLNNGGKSFATSQPRAR